MLLLPGGGGGAQGGEAVVRRLVSGLGPDYSAETLVVAGVLHRLATQVAREGDG